MRKKILTGFFVLLITSQVYGLALGHKVNLLEKRLLTKAPEYKSGRLLESTYYKKLSKFLDDRYPYRVPFIISKNWIDYYIFSTSPSQKVHIGKDGWFYFKRGMNNYFKDDCKKRKKARDLAKKLGSIERLFESSGKRFFFIVAPDKATIYPEHVAIERSTEACGKSFYDLFIEALGDYPLHGFIRLDSLLIDAKKDVPIYFVTGSHWNSRGSMIVSAAILNRLSTATKRYTMPEVKFKKTEQMRDLPTMWGLNLTEKTDAAIVINKGEMIKTKNLNDLTSGMPHLRITTAAAPDKPLLPRAIIYRDSFMSMPLVMMQGSFEEIDALWTHRVPVAPKVDFDALKDSKIIIIEVVERNLTALSIREKVLTWVLGGGLRYKRGRHRLQVAQRPGE